MKKKASKNQKSSQRKEIRLPEWLPKFEPPTQKPDQADENYPLAYDLVLNPRAQSVIARWLASAPQNKRGRWLENLVVAALQVLAAESTSGNSGDEKAINTEAEFFESLARYSLVELRHNQFGNHLETLVRAVSHGVALLDARSQGRAATRPSVCHFARRMMLWPAFVSRHLDITPASKTQMSSNEKLMEYIQLGDELPLEDYRARPGKRQGRPRYKRWNPESIAGSWVHNLVVWILQTKWAIEREYPSNNKDREAELNQLNFAKWRIDALKLRADSGWEAWWKVAELALQEAFQDESLERLPGLRFWKDADRKTDRTRLKKAQQKLKPAFERAIIRQNQTSKTSNDKPGKN